MTNSVRYGLVFTAGLVFGAALMRAYEYLKAQKEVGDICEPIEKESEEDEPTDAEPPSNIPEKPHSVEEPYVISDELFGEYDDYATIDLMYFADGVLTDDEFYEIAEVTETIGHEALEYLEVIDIYSDGVDVVYVRDDTRKCDYAITRDERIFDDAIQSMPMQQNYYDD